MVSSSPSLFLSFSLSPSERKFVDFDATGTDRPVKSICKIFRTLEYFARECSVGIESVTALRHSVETI